jgi:FAD-dependent urate hydroxylase
MDSDMIDVAIIGAGPYGLSVAAHLGARGVARRVFGQPMQAWTEKMPRGMYLKSAGYASNLSDPTGLDTLAGFCRSTHQDYADDGFPVPLDTFVSYGERFQCHHVPDIERATVTDLSRHGGQFVLSLDSGAQVRAASVVVAVGVQYFTHVPAAFGDLPGELVSHSSTHRDLSVLRGRDVLVVGAGQSALESAALLLESGARPVLMARSGRVRWNRPPADGRRSLLDRACDPRAPLGGGWPHLFYAYQPALFRRLPAEVRAQRARRALGPAGAWWLRSRFEGKVPVLLGQTPIAAAAVAAGIRVRARTRAGEAVDVETEHVIAATGYRAQLARLPFVDPALRAAIRTTAGTPAVDAGFQSSVPGLYFVGPLVAPTFGPVMRFVFGADFAARTVSRRLAQNPSRGPRWLPRKSTAVSVGRLAR